MTCPTCGNDNRVERKFCARCGAPLARVCPACGAGNGPDDRFCGECGSALEEGAAATEEVVAARKGPQAERRLVSVLFADLVGFTTLSEHRDAEEVRELLSRYFDTARQVIGRYGGTVEKFIGDAVMAVWGTPVAQEDDAERSVRAALDLVSAVAALGSDVGAPDLALRAGVVTGEAAVTVGAEGQGMVAGDLVNTAARVQSVASPGTVLVSEATWRASKAAIAYEEAGQHELKGKTEPVSLWRADRVIAGRGGLGRAFGLEAPFVGRHGELQLVNDLFHATGDERKARLVSVVGVAGIGKSRLAWEFEKYVDGLAYDVRWHRGRCLAYGEGVTFWALVEMLRMRARIAEQEDPESALEKLRAAIEKDIDDPDEREWVEPRLAHLLGLEERSAPDREDLFSAWRLFFERMAEREPTALVFEDLQWADPALLDFIEYLLDWSRNHPIFVLTVARPELSEQHPTWGAGKRNFTSLFLEPLPDKEMNDLLCGLVPGLPEEVRGRISDRAEGIPLYAVETVRSLLDRGLLERVGDEYRLTGPVEDLEVPETLHALIAARLDALTEPERRLLEDAAVLGKTFTKAAVGELSGLGGAEVDSVLDSLIRKEILTLQVDPLSPERGQYGFLQALVQKVAYDTLSLKERKNRHLAVAEYLETSWGSDDDEIIEVVASHYLDAYRAAPEAADAASIKTKARERLIRAGEHSASLAASEQAERYFEQARELADDPLDRAHLQERAGEVSYSGARIEASIDHFERAIELFEAAGQLHPAARVSAKLGRAIADRGRMDEALERLESSLAVLGGDEPDADLAALAAQLASLQSLAGEPQLAAARAELALRTAEALRLPELISQALNAKAFVLQYERRPEEGLALLERALKIALEHDLSSAATRAYNNLSAFVFDLDMYADALRYAEESLALARKRGDRIYEWVSIGSAADALMVFGRWDEALTLLGEFPIDAAELHDAFVLTLPTQARIQTAMGNADAVVAALARVADWPPGSIDLQDRATLHVGEAILLRAEGRLEEALAAGREAFEAGRKAAAFFYSNEGLIEAVEAAFDLDDLVTVEELLAFHEGLPPVERPEYLEAHRARFRARLAARRGEREHVEPGFKQAAASFNALRTPFWLAVSQLEYAEWLVSEERSDEAEPLLDEARETFERLRARPWLGRLATVGAQAEAAVTQS